MDSGASDTMFVSKDVFTGYKPITPCIGESAKAENGNFEIIGEGNVSQLRGESVKLRTPMHSICQN